MVGLTEEVPSSMVPEPRFWVQFLSVTHFLSLSVIILTYLIVSLSTHMSRTCGHDSHAEGGMLDYNIRDPLASFISPVFYGWTSRGGVV
jgi:hypothetical protein